MLQQVQNASGVTPVIINVQPLKDLSTFLGLNQEPANKSAEEEQLAAAKT
jgi:hypothetical protein